MKVQRLKKELSNKERRLTLSETTKRELSNELMERLKGLDTGANSTLQHG